MDTALDQRELEMMFDKAVREVTAQSAGIKLFPCSDPPEGELCTVHIRFKRGFNTSISLCANTSMFKRMACKMVGMEEVTHQDLEDFSKEYFNLLCGRIAAALFRETRIASRFSLPMFYDGKFKPEGHEPQFELNYFTDQREGAQLTHHVPNSGLRAELAKAE